jgi:hypothetical protein
MWPAGLKGRMSGSLLLRSISTQGLGLSRLLLSRVGESMTALTKQYLTGLAAISLIVALVASIGATLRVVGGTALLLFGGLDGWYIFKMRKGHDGSPAKVNWRKEATIIVVCLAILLLLLLKHFAQ